MYWALSSPMMYFLKKKHLTFIIVIKPASITLAQIRFPLSETHAESVLTFDIKYQDSGIFTVFDSENRENSSKLKYKW